MPDIDEDVDVQVAAKFAHLLKPIRDLAENWGVDIAHDLEDYLTHLNRTAFTFHNGPKLDFAEAALVIQSSACVYSRKVDFLHNLVLQALDAVRSKRAAAMHDDTDGPALADGAPAAGTQRARARKEANAPEPEDDTIEAFLAAGDSLQMCQDVDLVQEDTAPATYSRPPAALLALEDQCAEGGEGEAGFCRLAQCYVHVSGVLLLDPSDADLYDVRLNSTGVKAHSTWHTQPTQLQGDAGVVGTQGPTQQQQDPTQPQQQQQQEDEDDGYGDAGGMSDDDMGPPATQPAGDAAAAATAGEAGAGAAGAAAGPAAAPADAAADTHAAREAAHTERVALADQATAAGAMAGGVAGVGMQEEEEAEPFDVYKPLDMDGPGTLPIRPMQVKKPARGKIRPVVVPQQPLGAATRPHTRITQHTTLLNPEFSYGLDLLQSTRQHAAPAGKTRGQQARAADAAAAAPLVPVFDAADAAAAAQAEIERMMQIDAADGAAAVGVAGAGADGTDGDGGVGMWDDDTGCDYYGGGVGGGEDDDGPSAFGGYLQIEDLMGADLLQGPTRVEDLYGDGLPTGDEGASYEELCRAHIDALMARAAAQEVQTELAVRVTGWRDKIDPVLRDEEARKAFDIQQYQQRIIGTLDKKTQDVAPPVESVKAPPPPIEFGAVAAQHVKWEVSRTFAAMLQLINNKNVAIVHSGPPDAPFSLQLLNSELLHKTMGKRLAAGAGHDHAAHEGDADMADPTDGNPLALTHQGEDADDATQAQQQDGADADASRRPSQRAGAARKTKATAKPSKKAKTGGANAGSQDEGDMSEGGMSEGGVSSEDVSDPESSPEAARKPNKKKARGKK